MRQKRVRIDLQLNKCTCGLSQDQQAVMDNYISTGKPAAILNLNRSYQIYIRDCLANYKKSLSRNIKLAKKPGYAIYRFYPAQWTDDMYEINTSMPVRSGGAMRQAYLRKPDELADAYQMEPGPADEQCPKHWRRWYGCFKAEEDQGLGEKKHDFGEDAGVGNHPPSAGRHKMVAYISLRRLGSLCLYGLVLGHGDHLLHGVMYRLHFHILRRLLDKTQLEAQGATHLMYGGFMDGNKGLRKWKKRLLFEPAKLELKQKKLMEV